MVHAFSFLYEEPHYFLWDTESGSLHKVDFAAFLCAKVKFSEELTEEEKLAYQKLDETTRIELEQEFSELESDGSLNRESLLKDFKKNNSVIKALCLHICHDCNLCCDYCFASGGTYNTEKDYMSVETGKKAIDFLIKNSGNRKNLEVDFFGGEPLMNMSTVKAVVSYAKEEAKKYEKSFTFTMTTNCLLLDDKNIDFLNKEMENIVLSIDGRKETHNKVRHSKNSKDVYDLILNNAKKLRSVRGDKRYYVRGTFTAKNLDFSEDVLTLNDFGFDQISIEPVVLPDSSEMAIREEHLPVILKQYDRLAEEYINRRKTQKWFNFFHFMVDLEGGSCINKRLTGCGAGTEYLAVSPIGDVYPCHQFVGRKEFLLGSVYGEVKKDESFAEVNVLSKEHCKKCFAKYYCGGGCMANALNFSGSIAGQYKIGCEMTKKRFELSLAIAALGNFDK